MWACVFAWRPSLSRPYWFRLHPRLGPVRRSSDLSSVPVTSEHASAVAYSNGSPRLLRNCRGWHRHIALSRAWPHGPSLCVRGLGTQRGHRSLSSDLTLPHDNTAYAVSVWLLRRKL